METVIIAIHLMIVIALVGVILLLPGLCSLAFMAMVGTSGAGGMWLIWIGTFLVGWGGFVLLRKALGN